jgi:hypothetical protein
MRFAAEFAVGVFLCLATWQTQAAEIDYLEDFALAKDRTVPLQQLIPGTEDYYYYHCLHFQNTEQFDKANELLTTWINRFKDTPRIREIQNRQALLTYTKTPDKSLEFIRQRLGLQFNHQRERLDEKPNLPTSLDQNLIARQTLLARAFAQHPNLQGCEDAALDWLVGTELNPDRRRHLLERLQRPDYPQLPKLVVDDLNFQNSGGFGSFGIHGQLLLAQLDGCLKLKPDLLNQQNFVNAYLTKLRPNADVDWRHDPVEHRAYLDRLWSFVQRLAPVHNSLKAHVLYHRLALDRSQGVYDKPTFLTYLQTPRNANYVNPKFLELEDNRRHTADLAANFENVTLLPPVGNDEPLVRSYLQQFFVKETTYQPYAPLVNDVYLKRTFAETKIVNGLGEGEQWAAMLTPAEYQALKDRIDLDFAETNAQRFAADAPVSLDLFVKNVKTLLVKVYEINTGNFYRQNQTDVNTDINLDGLVANQETTHEYPEPPLQRVRRHFEFPELTKPGVYVIDFIGNGQSSRAVIRKGQLRHLVRTTTAGHIFGVLDEQNRKLPKATLWFGGREYTPRDSGKGVRSILPERPATNLRSVPGSAQNAPDPFSGDIVVPFTNTPQRQAIVLQHGDFCAIDYFQHQAEEYSLVAGIYVDRESLLRRQKAQVVIRPQLYLAGIPVTLSVLEDVRLVITSTDHDGVATTKEVKGFKLFEDREATYEFQVPQRLSQIRFELKAKVQNLSQNKKVDLAVQESFALNQIDQTEKVEGLHLLRVQKGGQAPGIHAPEPVPVSAAGEYVVDLLGRTGEVKADRPVRFTLKHRDFREPVQVTLQTDPQGRVRLGALADIVSVSAAGPEDVTQAWTLDPDQHTYYQTLHGVEGQPLEVPYLGKAQGKPARDEASLLELRADSFVVDRFEALAVDGGLLRITNLARGDYDLWLKKENQRIRIRIAAGQQRDGYVLAENRQLEVRGERPLQIAAVETADDAVTVRLQNSSKFARVHVFATRYDPAYAAFGHLSRVRDAEPGWLEPRKLEALYIAGRNIGDEYRYILDRKYAKKFPGNMLERPSLLLNPWAVRSTETGEQQAAAGADFAKKSDQAGGGAGRGEGKAAAAVAGGDFVNLDFLAQASAVLLNLAADETGVVSIPRQELGPHQHLHIVAVDPRSTAYRSLSLPEPKAAFVDLRLANGLDPKLNFAQQKQVSVADGKQPFAIADITSARLETYDSLAKVYSLYVTLSNNPTLIEFGFLMNWPNLKPEEKRVQYSKYACHELHFFLYHKDPEFFRAVVQPYLKNKKDKQFLDHWLLGDDLAAYAQPWNYAQLNAAERILLSQRVAADRQHTVRDTADRFALIPRDVERFHMLFETALKGRALESSSLLTLTGAGDFLSPKEAQQIVLEHKLSTDITAMMNGIHEKLSRDPDGAFKDIRLALESVERNKSLSAEQRARVLAPIQSLMREAGRRRIMSGDQRALEDAKKAMATESRRIPPAIDGIVVAVAVGDKNLIEISLGSDDGLRVGHRLGISRNNVDLGSAVVVKTDTDRCVAQLDQKSLKGEIKVRDRVRTATTAGTASEDGELTQRLRKYAPIDLERKKSLDIRSVDAYRDRDGEFEAYFDDESELRAEARQFYRKLDKTQEWAENNYYHLPIDQQNADLIAVNAFWRDYARFDPGQGQGKGKRFRSVNFAEASHNFPEMMFALAVLDLPFTAEKHETKFDQAQMTLTPGSPLILFHEEIKQVPAAKEQTPILVSQNFFRHGDRTQQVNNEQVDKFVTDEFLVGVVYGCQVVVTNPTSSKQKLDVLLQIPRGAILVLKGRETRSVHIDLEPYHTQTLEYHFYFPAPGEFPHYPVQVSKNEQLVAHAAPVTLKSVAKLSRIDKASWEYLSQFGTSEDVLKYLEQANLHRTNLDKIAFRVQDKAFFGTVTGLLAQRHAYSDTLWSYSLKHNAPAVAREYLQHADGFVGQCGAFIDSPLLTIDPVARRAYQHLDYRPLVNARAHQLGLRRQIVNDRFHAQYHQLLKILSYRADLDDAELMAVTYYLLLQDRIDEALGTFGRVHAEQLATRLQYDYFASYLAMVRQQPQQAREIAAKYAQYPVDRWRDLFTAMLAQLGEIAGQDTKVVDKESRTEVQTKLAATEASFDFQVEAKKVTLNYQNLKQVQVNYYLMDIELLFSRNPFVQQYSGQFSNIRPNLTQTVELPPKQAALTFDLPKQLHSSNVLVEITGVGQTKSRAYYANALAVQVVENYGQIQVKHSETGKPLAKVYVKVYAQMQDGTVKFYKDGYTDLRGRFDYTSLSTNELDFAKKFSLLVLSDEHGAVVREASPPQR